LGSLDHRIWKAKQDLRNLHPSPLIYRFVWFYTLAL
jgi:hypothetical protein